MVTLQQQVLLLNTMLMVIRKLKFWIKVSVAGKKLDLISFERKVKTRKQIIRVLPGFAALK